MKKYCIKNNYIHRKQNYTHDQYRQGHNTYWNLYRLLNARFYQYHFYRYAADIAMRQKIKTVVDIGCGPAIKLIELLRPVVLEVIGIDQPNVINYCRKKYGRFSGVNFYSDDFENPSLKQYRRVDMVICSDVIEHLQNPDNLLEYIKQFCDSKTLVLLSTPERDILRGKNNTYSPNESHVREWNAKEFVSYLEQEGFEILEHRLFPALRLSLYWPPLTLQYIKYALTGRLHSNQGVLCRLKV